jgi:hypothetical protein
MQQEGEEMEQGEGMARSTASTSGGMGSVDNDHD